MKLTPLATYNDPKIPTQDDLHLALVEKARSRHGRVVKPGIIAVVAAGVLAVGGGVAGWMKVKADEHPKIMGGAGRVSPRKGPNPEKKLEKEKLQQRQQQQRAVIGGAAPFSRDATERITFERTTEKRAIPSGAPLPPKDMLNKSGIDR